MLRFVELDWRALRFGSEEVRADLDIVGAAVDQDYRALKFAAEPAKADRMTVLRAVRQDNPLGVLENWRALELASFYLRSDKAFMQHAAFKTPAALKYATDVVINDKHFILRTTAKNWKCLDYAGPNLKQDRPFMLHAVGEAEGGKGIRLHQIPQW